jgi:hypothetical protein
MYRSFSIQILLAFFLTQGPIARAQRPLFGVYLATGTIKCTPARGPSRLISRYDWLYPGDRLSLLDNISQITLFGRDTTYVCLHGKGTYTIDQIKKNAAHLRPGHTPHPIFIADMGRSHSNRPRSQPRLRRPRPRTPRKLRHLHGQC